MALGFRISRAWCYASQHWVGRARRNVGRRGMEGRIFEALEGRMFETSEVGFRNVER